jgi:PadR family transcriptional regulator PadR
MPNPDTEMLKGILEGIVLAVIGERPTHGYDITASLRDQGFTDIAEGTVYALLVRIEQRGLVDVEKVPSEKGPPRKVFTLTSEGHTRLDDFWGAWKALSDRLDRLRSATATTSPSPIEDSFTKAEDQP